MTKNLPALELSILLLLTTCGIPSIAFSQQGGPIADLQDNIAQIEATIAELTQSAGSISTTIDCVNEQTVSAFIDAHSDTSAPLIITVKGKCTENILLTRGRVVLKGDPTDGLDEITAADINETVLFVNGANEIVIEHLAITGNIPSLFSNASGIGCRANSAVTISNVEVTRARNGITAGMSGQCDVTDSNIHDNNGFGLLAVNNGALFVLDTQITGNGNGGVRADRGGHASVFASQNSPLGVEISDNNGNGIEAVAGGSVRVSGSQFPGPSTRLFIRGNTGAGVFIGNMGMFEPIAWVSFLDNAMGGIVCSLGSPNQPPPNPPPPFGAFELRWRFQGTLDFFGNGGEGDLSAQCPVTSP